MKQHTNYFFALIVLVVLSACGPSQAVKGGKIAFVSFQFGQDVSFAERSDIYVMDADGSNPTNLTSNGANSYSASPVLSPDGARIAFFSSSQDGNSEVYVMGADGGNPTRLTNNGVRVSVAGGLAWSPDGQQIVFVADVDIYVMDADGGNLTRLTNIGVERQQVPAWSPDGQQIVFIFEDDIYVMDADGGNLTQLTNTTERTLKVFFSPTWSPDGDKITFFAHREDNYDMFNSDIYVMDADGGNLTRLTNTKGRVGNPTWSPDGEHIAFISEEGAGSSDIDAYYAVDIYVMDADGGNPTRLTNNGVWVSGGLAWSPDGQQIAFLFEEDSGILSDDLYFEIYVMDADGGNLTRLTFNGVWLGFAWSP